MNFFIPFKEAAEMHISKIAAKNKSPQPNLFYLWLLPTWQILITITIIIILDEVLVEEQNEDVEVVLEPETDGVAVPEVRVGRVLGGHAEQQLAVVCRTLNEATGRWSQRQIVLFKIKLTKSVDGKMTSFWLFEFCNNNRNKGETSSLGGDSGPGW